MKFETTIELLQYAAIVIIFFLIGSGFTLAYQKYKSRVRHKKWTVIYNEFLAGNLTASQYARICAIVLNNALNRQ